MLSGVRLNRSSKAPFMHVNPRAVKWAQANLLPSPVQPMCGATAGDVYRRALSFAVRSYADAYRHHQQLGSFKKLKSRIYLAEMEQGKGPYNDGCVEFSKLPGRGANEVRWQACHFWLRRHIDGSRKAFAKLLVAVLKDFDPEYWREHGAELKKR